MEDTHTIENANTATVKKVPTPIKETSAQKIARLEQEMADMKVILNSQPRISVADAKYMTDLDFFDKQKVGAGKIEMKAICDHKNISLWTPWGKRIGPMHPNNARYTYNKFRRLGRILYTAKPSEDEIQAYYKTPEYITWKKQYDKDRARKDKSKSKDGLNKVIDAMVKITGETRANLISIIDKPLAGAQK